MTILATIYLALTLAVACDAYGDARAEGAGRVGASLIFIAVALVWPAAIFAAVGDDFRPRRRA